MEAIKNNEIIYKSVDGKKIEAFENASKFGENLSIVSHTYENGIGRVVFDSDVTSIGQRAFSYCSALSSITLPNSVIDISCCAFYCCKSLENINIPNSVTSIGNWAFSSCNSLSCITIPNSVKHIGEYAFNDCNSLESINIPNSVKIICGSAFNYCTSLKNITIPNSVTHICGGAFNHCTSLKHITIPKSITHIGFEAFSHCTYLNDKLSNRGRYFKAFNADMICRGFKYEEGQSYHCDNIELCKQGFHYCTSILELFNYYWGKYGKDIVIHEVFPSGKIRKSNNNSTKCCCSDITIGRRIDISEIGDLVSEMLK